MTATDSPLRSSQSGDAATARTASAQEGSMLPAATHASSWRCSASPRSRSPCKGSVSSRSAGAVPVTVVVASGGPSASRVKASVSAPSAPVGADVAHPLVQRPQPVGGDGTGGLRRQQPGLDQPAEVHEVTPPPVGLPLGRAGADGVDGPQRLGDDAATQLGGAAAGAWSGGLREDDAARTAGAARCRHVPRLPRLAGAGQPPQVSRTRSRAAAARAPPAGPAAPAGRRWRRPRRSGPGRSPDPRPASAAWRTPPG